MEILLPFNILIKLGVFNPLKSSSKIYCGELNCTIHIVQVKCQWFCLMGFFWVVLFCFLILVLGLQNQIKLAMNIDPGFITQHIKHYTQAAFVKKLWHLKTLLGISWLL